MFQKFGSGSGQKGPDPQHLYCSSTVYLLALFLFCCSIVQYLLYSIYLYITNISITNLWTMQSPAKPSQAESSAQILAHHHHHHHSSYAGKFSKIHKMFTQKICLTKIIFKFFVKLIIVKNVTTASRKFRKHS